MASAKFRSVGRPTDLNLAGAILFRDIFQTIPPQVDNRTLTSPNKNRIQLYLIIAIMPMLLYVVVTQSSYQCYQPPADQESCLVLEHSNQQKPLPPPLPRVRSPAKGFCYEASLRQPWGANNTQSIVGDDHKKIIPTEESIQIMPS